MGNSMFHIDKNVFWNWLELDEKVFQNEWHSYCISINLEESVGLGYHNGKLIARQQFEVMHNETKILSRLMHRGTLAAHTGAVADIQIFSRALPMEDMESWTKCEKEVTPFIAKLSYSLLVHCQLN